MVYRESTEAERIAFIELSPLLYQWLNLLDESVSAKQALLEIFQNQSNSQSKIPSFELSKLLDSAHHTLQNFQSLGLVKQG
ncbi:hypothetical protein THMIRHAM_18500 [Thiomicrorhabdus immobilis]|uniref:Uncharacterized protein n=1 Tax=Thiomicrorhabdus immobilis TaxID=2791037 RepID=A0ABM7MF68_9GAMM|nr:hypothetical protein [Thiomicrorhabdus immobilis]BCN94065.1 hypothetical protein THMIRHAM_18500 [Thiomicrorhabdus immobilis]